MRDLRSLCMTELAILMRHSRCMPSVMAYVSLCFVDLRWGITASDACQNKTVDICLHEIDSADIFIGLYGARYTLKRGVYTVTCVVTCVAAMMCACSKHASPPPL
jgi:hypothetical protein